jgi:hypothetical protein
MGFKGIFLLFSAMALNVSAQDRIVVPRDLGFESNSSFTLETLNPLDVYGTAGPEEMTIMIERNRHSSDSLTLVGSFNREKRQCVEYAEQGWLLDCARWRGRGEYQTKEYILKIDFSEAVDLFKGESEVYQITFGIDRSIDRYPRISEARLIESPHSSEQIVIFDEKKVMVDRRR